MHDADAAPLVAADVDHDPLPLLGDLAHGVVQLGAAVAAQRPEDVTGQALAVHAHHDVGLVLGVAVDQGEVVVGVHLRAVADGAERPHGGGDVGLGHAVDQLL